MEYEKAKGAAAKLIAQKMYTCNEIHQRLIRKGFSSETAERVVSEFAGAGILNDEEYAKMYIHDAVCVNMKGMYRIKHELMKKGIAASVIEKAEMETEVDGNAQLEGYVELKFGGKVFSDWKEVEKAKAHLVRRGFGIYDINKCFDKLGIKAEWGGEN